MENLNFFGKVIKKARENYMLSLRELADLLEEDHSNLSKIENGELNIKSDRLIKILLYLDIRLDFRPISKNVIDNFDFINQNLGLKSIKDISLEIKTDRLKLKRELVRLARVKKIDEKKLEGRQSSKKYGKEEKLIEDLEIGKVLNLNLKAKNEIVYLRSVLVVLKKTKNKEFLTKTENDFDLIIVRIK